MGPNGTAPSRVERYIAATHERSDRELPHRFNVWLYTVSGFYSLHELQKQVLLIDDDDDDALLFSEIKISHNMHTRGRMSDFLL